MHQDALEGTKISRLILIANVLIFHMLSDIFLIAHYRIQVKKINTKSVKDDHCHLVLSWPHIPFDFTH